MTLAYLIIPREDKAKPKRLVRNCFNAWKANPKTEVKGNKLTSDQQDRIIGRTKTMLGQSRFAHLGAITVKKQNVREHIRKDGNILYNYMLGLGLLDAIKQFDHVNLIRDERSMKVKSGNSIGDYLQTQLWFELKTSTIIKDMPQNSERNNSIQFIDWISYMVWSAYEDRNDRAFQLLKPILNIKSLFM